MTRPTTSWEVLASLPARFWSVPYVFERYPGAPGVAGLDGGANCQQYAYEVLRHFGLEVPDLRSSILWCDYSATEVVTEPEPLDLMLVHRWPDSFGAHVAVYVGDDKALHLAKSVGHPSSGRSPSSSSAPNIGTSSDSSA